MYIVQWFLYMFEHTWNSSVFIREIWKWILNLGHGNRGLRGVKRTQIIIFMLVDINNFLCLWYLPELLMFYIKIKLFKETFVFIKHF